MVCAVTSQGTLARLIAITDIFYDVVSPTRENNARIEVDQMHIVGRVALLVADSVWVMASGAGYFIQMAAMFSESYIAYNDVPVMALVAQRI